MVGRVPEDLESGVDDVASERGVLRYRISGFVAGAMFALGVLGAVAVSHGGGVSGLRAAAALGRGRDEGWLVPKPEEKEMSAKQAMPAYLGDAPRGRSIVNKEGGLPVGSHASLTSLGNNLSST